MNGNIYKKTCIFYADAVMENDLLIIWKCSIRVTFFSPQLSTHDFQSLSFSAAVCIFIFSLSSFPITFATVGLTQTVTEKSM